MIRFIFRRLAYLVPVLLGITFFAFLLIHIAPGDPVFLILGDEYSNVELRERVSSELGLDEPFWLQYARWLGRLAVADMGNSLFSGADVVDVVLGRLPVTLLLAGFTLLIAVVVGISAGVISATNSDRWIDNAVRVVATVGVAIPVFWLGIMLILVFALYLNWFPAGGGPSRHGLKALVLPSIALSASFAALLTRIVRSEVLEALQQDYVRTARAKGLRPFAVHFGHTLKNALIPVITVIGAQLGILLSGAVLTEHVFSLPGLGSLLIDSIYRRDFPLIQGSLLIVGSGFVLVNLLVDMLYAVVDPRVRYA